MAAATIIAALMAVSAAAQAPPAPKAAPKAQPKAAQPPPAAPPAAAPAQPPPQSPQAAAAPDQGLVYVPWSKFCEKGQQAGTPQICMTGRFGRDGTGVTTVMAMVVEWEGSSRRALRVTLPLGMQLEHGMNAAIDQSRPVKAPFVVCLPNGCMAEYEASEELIGKLKTGQALVVQGINYLGEEATYTLPLSGFALSYDGLPTDPKAQEEQQKKLEDELQRRAAEARKRLETQTPPK
jgi:invasion protein IalB